MPRFRTKPASVVLAAAIALVLGGAISGCDSAPAAPEGAPLESGAHIDEPKLVNKPKLGLMTSLPLYWPLGADFAALAGGDAAVPWQRGFLEKGHDLVLLDTLTPIPDLNPDAPETDPLDGLDRLAVLQPRGLSPADNVALDNWVKAGGHLLIALDPLLTGEYDIALGDPRRPTDAALIPPVIARWGLAGSFDPAQESNVRYAELPGAAVPLLMSGESRVVDAIGGPNGCETHESGSITRCGTVGKGSVTYLHDAAVFEHRELVGEQGEAISALLDFAFR